MKKKTVLITGASRGIGRGCALLFAQKGYHVFLNCHSSLTELKKVKHTIEVQYEGTCEIVAGDVGNADDVARIFASIFRTCNHLDVLINNAGISHIGLLMDMKNEEWNQILQTNLSSVFYCCRAAIPSMISRKSGRIRSEETRLNSSH